MKRWDQAGLLRGDWVAINGVIILQANELSQEWMQYRNELSLAGLLSLDM